MYLSKKTILFLLFLSTFFNSKHIFAGGLLPETLVEVGEDECQMIKDLSVGDNVISMDLNKDECLLYDAKVTRLKERRLSVAVLLELKSEDGKKGLLMVSKDQKLFRTSALRKIKSELINRVGYSREKRLQNLINEIWVNAKDLEVGDKIRGSQYNELEVVNAEYIRFDKRVKCYELSLNEYHTFYVIDSAGHYVLTHNLTIWAAVGIGALIGATLGGGYTAWKAHKAGVLSFGTVIKGVAIGGIVGGVAAAAMYGGVAAWAKWGPGIVTKIDKILEAHPFIKDVVKYYKEHDKAVNTTSCIAGSFLFKEIRKLVTETSRRENEDIDQSGVDDGL